jgi:hypothetical protein
MIFRSAFWLAVGFLLVAPHGTDFGAIATDARNQAIAAGTEAAQQLITTQILAEPTITQAVATAVVAKLVTSSQTSSPNSHNADLHPMQGSPARPFVFPFPRPAALG